MSNSSVDSINDCPCDEHIFHSTCHANCECWGEPYDV